MSTTQERQIPSSRDRKEVSKHLRQYGWNITKPLPDDEPTCSYRAVGPNFQMRSCEGAIINGTSSDAMEGLAYAGVAV